MRFNQSFRISLFADTSLWKVSILQDDDDKLAVLPPSAIEIHRVMLLNASRVLSASVVDGESHDRVAQAIHRVCVTGGKVDRKLANPDFSKPVSALVCPVLAVMDAEDFNRDLDGLGS